MSEKLRGGGLWSAAEVAQLESMMDQHIDVAEIARQLGRTEKAILTKYSVITRDRTGPGQSARKRRRRDGASFFLS